MSDDETAQAPLAASAPADEYGAVRMAGQMSVNGSAPGRVALSGDGTLEVPPGCGPPLRVAADAVGVALEGREVVVHAYPAAGPGEASCCGGPAPGVRSHREVRLAAPGEEAAARWAAALREHVPAQPAGEVLVLVNPAAGSGSARKRWHDEFEPVFRHAAVRHRVVVTEHAGHAEAAVAAADLDEVRALCIVSGDGLVSEAYAGLARHPEWERALRVPLAVLPAGSGNGLVKSALAAAGEPYSLCNAAFAAVRGRARPLDLMLLRQRGRPPVVGFLNSEWAMMSDIDFGSERWRKLCGEARFDFQTVVLLCAMRRYTGRIGLLPAPGVAERPKAGGGGGGGTVPDVPVCGPGCDRCVSAEDDDGEGHRALVRAIRRARAAADRAGGGGAAGVAEAAAEDADDPNDEDHADAEDWEYTEADARHTTVWLQNLAWGAVDVTPTPSAHFSDGCMDIMMVDDQIGCCGALGVFLNVDTGAHVEDRRVVYRKVLGYRLEPAEAGPTCEIGFDGERVFNEPLEIRVYRAAGRVVAL